MRQTPKSRHTPGPWQISAIQNEPEKTSIIDADMCFVAEVWQTYIDGESRQQAHAALIAAAPELLAIIKDMRQAFYVEGTRKALLQVMERSKDLIAKAEGRQS